MLEIKEAVSSGDDACMLIGELNSALEKITGCSGASGFISSETEELRNVFLIAYVDGKPVGCGALRKYTQDTAEIKRVYARPNKEGIGSTILQELEKKAHSFGYHKIILETRKVNKVAVNFYLHKGYKISQNYGKYQKNIDAVCFTKLL